MIHNVIDYGAVGDGNPANATKNTVAFNNAIANAANSNNPGPVYVPMSTKGFVVNNGQIRINTPNVVMYGDASMGSGWPNSSTSTIIGTGTGHTLTVSGMGCNVKNLVFRQFAQGTQKGSDAFVLVQDTTCTISDLYLGSPNIGISLQLLPNVMGEFWIKDILVEGLIGTAGVVANAGNATVHLNHVIMSNFGGPQPPFGIKVTSCGELIIDNGCDIINCGNCLAIVPGIDGVKNQYVNAIFVSDSLFDGGDGQGTVWISPSNGGYVLTAKFTNVWASTAGNNNGTSPTNGFLFDGSHSTPALPTLRAIQDVSLSNCVSKSFRRHCGVYATAVDALSIQGCTFGDCFNGIQIAKGCSSFVLIGNKCGNYVPPSVPNAAGGNEAYGILIEPTTLPFTAALNMCYGNGIGTILNQNPPRPFQMLQLNQ